MIWQAQSDFVTLFEQCNIGNITSEAVNIYRKFVAENTFFLVAHSVDYTMMQCMEWHCQMVKNPVQSSIFKNKISHQKVVQKNLYCLPYVTWHEKRKILNKIQNYFNYKHFMCDLRSFLTNIGLDVSERMLLRNLYKFFDSVNNEIRSRVIRTLILNCRKEYHYIISMQQPMQSKFASDFVTLMKLCIM